MTLDKILEALREDDGVAAIVAGVERLAIHDLETVEQYSTGGEEGPMPLPLAQVLPDPPLVTSTTGDAALLPLFPVVFMPQRLFMPQRQCKGL